MMTRPSPQHERFAAGRAARQGTARARREGRLLAVTLLRWLALACHAGPTAAMTTLAVVLAAGAGPGKASAVGVAVLAGQLSVGWSNDWVDADRDRQVARTNKPVVQGLPVPVLRRAALLALTACVPLSLALGPRAGAAHLIAVASAWLYNAGLKSTAWSLAPYVVAFGVLPSVITLAATGTTAAPAWATVAGVLLGTGVHGLNELPDLAEDDVTGVRGLPHRLGPRRTAVLSVSALVAAAAVVATLGSPLT